MYLATTRAALIRGTVTADTLGDETRTDAEVEGWADFPAAIHERSRVVFDPASGEQRTIRIVRGSVPPKLPVEDGDRIRDNRTGKLFAVEEITHNERTLSGQSALTLDLRDTRG